MRCLPYSLEKEQVFKEGLDSSGVRARNSLFYQNIADGPFTLGSVDGKNIKDPWKERGESIMGAAIEISQLQDYPESSTGFNE